MPPSRPSDAAGEMPQRNQDGQAADAQRGNDAVQTPGQTTASDGQRGDDGWETSTELPNVLGDGAHRGAADQDSADQGPTQQGENGNSADANSTADAERNGDNEERGDNAGGQEVAAGDAAGGNAEEQAGATSGQRRAGEGDVLARALEDLDGEIRDERTAATHRAGRPGAGADGAPNRPAGHQGEGDDAGAQGTSQSGGGAMPGRRTVASALPSTPSPPLPGEPDTPDARDDDVVARQLREAAMAETDPELREALWEELERYKSGLKRRR